MMKILLVAGARPNFMKIAPLVHVLKEKGNGVVCKFIHTGQHYDYEMSKAFFDDFDLQEPDYFLNIGSASHAQQTARIMMKFERVCLEEKPDTVVVVGDVNSTLACSITAKKLNIRVAHIEAGLRSNDLTMPEEINRIITDSISDYLFVTEKSGVENLLKEGKNRDQIYFVGNIMIDTLYYALEKLKKMKSVAAEPFRFIHTSSKYAVVTLHRPSNVDNRLKFEEIINALSVIARDMTVFFPMHPRTKKSIEEFGFHHLFENIDFKILPPLSYLAFLSLWKNAELVLTDSGGIQEETTALGIPCFTIRDNTERPITVEEGTNILTGSRGKGIISSYEMFKNGNRKKGTIPVLWDGKTAERIIKRLVVA